MSTDDDKKTSKLPTKALEEPTPTRKAALPHNGKFDSVRAPRVSSPGERKTPRREKSSTGLYRGKSTLYKSTPDIFSAVQMELENEKKMEVIISKKPAGKSGQPQSPFDKPDDYCDLTLLVENKRLHVHRSMLANASAVWKSTLATRLREKRTEIELAGKRYYDILELLMCIYPSHMKPVTGRYINTTL